MPDRSILTIIGGGVWVAALIEQLVIRIKEQQLEIRLVAQDLDRLESIADRCRRISTGRDDWRILAQPLEAALEGSDICVLLLRVGGLAARELDENFPRHFGLTGDEGLGLGGYANALRTLPVMATIAKRLTVASPKVIAINMVAPLGAPTRVLLDHGVKAIGLCELPITTERALRKTFPSDRFDHPLCFTGLNHLGWFWPPNLDLALFEEAVAARLVDKAVLHKFNAVPLHYYYKIFNRAAAHALGITEGAGRAQEVSQISAQTFGEIKSGSFHTPSLYKRMMPWFEDALVPVLGGLLDDGSWHGFANLRHNRRASWCEANFVIEGRVTIGRSSIVLEVPPEPTSAPLRNFLASAARAEGCVHQAALGVDPARNLRTALEEGPLDLLRSQLFDITRAICDAGRQFRP
jgi:6-phospho-beta-glucosidase